MSDSKDLTPGSLAPEPTSAVRVGHHNTHANAAIMKRKNNNNSPRSRHVWATRRHRRSMKTTPTGLLQ